jgi:poly-gamma-glutamate capsule biosynthesis protein CapA/YwtB (metallophosphatase superfamily)
MWPFVRIFLSLVLAGSLCACATPAKPTSAPAPASRTPPAEVTLAFGGDVHFEDRTRVLLDRPETAFGGIAALLSKADLAFVNLETAVTERGEPEPKEFRFRAPARVFTAVKAAGIDAVSLANNHALDYGRIGLADTLDAARREGVPALGAGLAGDAYRPWIREVAGVRIAVVALNHVNELWREWSATDAEPGLAMLREEQRALEAIREAKRSADVVVAWTHWGPEYQECPNADLKRLAASMIEAGADLIVGGHQHLLLGAGWAGKAYVAYGMGNFLWWRNDAASNDTGVLWVTIRERELHKAELVPAHIDRVTGQPALADAEVAQRIRDDQVRLRECAGLAEFRAD